MTPDFNIVAGADDVTEIIRKGLVLLRMTDKDGMEADQVEIQFADPGGRIALPRRGVTLLVAMGWKGEGLIDKGTFTVDEVGEDGPPDVITIMARSADFRTSLKDTRDASYSATTLGDILDTIAQRNDLGLAVHPELAATAINHIDQTNESDANFVTRLGDDYGAVATVKAGKVLFVPKGRGQTASGALLPTVTIDRRDGDRHSFRAVDRDGTQTGIKAKWHDLTSGYTNLVLAGKEGSVRTLKSLYPTQAEAQAAATAEWDRQQGKIHEFDVTLAKGRADILAGAPFVLNGWREEITAITWVGQDITHELNGSGFTTQIKAQEFTPKA